MRNNPLMIYLARLDNQILIYFAIAWLVIACIRRAWKAGARCEGADGPAHRLKATLPIALNFLAALCFSLSILLGARLCYQGPTLAALHALACVILMTSTSDVFVSWRYPADRRWRPGKLVAGLLAVALAAGLLVIIIGIRAAPTGGNRVLAIDYPVNGGWRVVAGGGFAFLNYHHDHPRAQNFALDLVCEYGETEGEKVYAPLEGVVVKAENDRAPGSPEAEGNVVIIQSAEGIELWLAHLKQHSVLVKKGERVARGQAIGECGATGSAETAHLHLHAQRGEEPVPLVFGNERKFLVRNDRFIK